MSGSVSIAMHAAAADPELHAQTPGPWRQGGLWSDGHPRQQQYVGRRDAYRPRRQSGLGSESDSLTSYGDLYPQATLKWNSGVNNAMVYLTADIPVGDYDPDRLSNIGIGDSAIDAGYGYTYFDTKKGHEFCAVLGLTYNFENTA